MILNFSMSAFLTLFILFTGCGDHENIYADGDPGECKILETEQKAFEANTQMRGFEVIAEYCSWDVQTMFRIARWCEQNYI